MLDVSVPGNPQVVGEYTIPPTIEPYNYMNEITVVNDFAFIGTSKGIVILDVYDKENIELIEFYEDESEFLDVNDIEFHGEYLYYTTYEDGLEIVEVKLEPLIEIKYQVIQYSSYVYSHLFQSFLL